MARLLLVFLLCGCAVKGPVLPRPGMVAYPEKVRADLFFLYTHIQEVEFAFCAFGRIGGTGSSHDTLFVERIELADIKKAVPDTIWATCPENSLGLGHSHRKAWGKRACAFSPADLHLVYTRKHPFAWVLCWDEDQEMMGIVFTSKHRVHGERKETEPGGNDAARDRPESGVLRLPQS